MTDKNIYSDIARRTGGDIYIGVVGPCRTGKSTFIKKFMETLVLPNIENEYDRARTRDEMPQSGSGRTVMTTEPKFIPDEAVSVSLPDNIKMRVKMVDCVGYVVPDALGQLEDGQARMVRTPWSEEPMPFAQAAAIGTKRVMQEHSTIGLVVTTDGSIGEIPREGYVEAEGEVIREMKNSGRPFAIILNSALPESAQAEALALELESKYSAPVALVNCLDIDGGDILGILELVLLEFPISKIRVEMPSWMCALPKGHWLYDEVCKNLRECTAELEKVGEIRSAFEMGMGTTGDMPCLDEIDTNLGTGEATVKLVAPSSLYFKVISELCEMQIGSDEELVKTLCDLSQSKREYDKVAAAIADVNEKGYGIVMPDIDALRFEEPQIIKQAGGYGVKLRAAAKSIHMIKADIETEINPIVGTEAQSEEVVSNLMQEYEADPKKIWESNMLGKSLYELVNEGLHSKLENMPADARQKLSQTLERIINEGSGGLICIIL